MKQFLLAYVKTHNNSKDRSVSRIKFLFRPHWLIFSGIHLCSGQFSGAQTAFRTTFRVTGRYRKAVYF